MKLSEQELAAIEKTADKVLDARTESEVSPFDATYLAMRAQDMVREIRERRAMVGER